MTIIWDHILNGVYMGWQITLRIFVVVNNSVCSFKGISVGYLIMVYNSGLGTSNLGVINGHFRDPICRGTICKGYGSAMWGIFYPRNMAKHIPSDIIVSVALRTGDVLDLSICTV